MIPAVATDASGDFRFLLPAIPRRVAVVGDLDPARLGAAGVELVDPRHADTVVAAGADHAAAAATGAQQVVLFGRSGRRALARAGYRTARWVALGSGGAVDGWVSPDQRRAASYAAGVWRRPPSPLRRVALGASLATGIVPPDREVLIVGTRGAAAPAWTALLATAGVAMPGGPTWFLATPGVEAESRVAAFVFGREAPPVAVVKVLRTPGVEGPFAADAAGLALVAPLGPEVADHVPALLARGTVDGHHASVESAATGRPLSKVLLDGTVPFAARRAAVDRVAAWAVALGAASVGDPIHAEAAVAALRREVAGAWPGIGPALVDGLPPLPAVVGHGDLGTWNVMADGDAFTVLDWEAARPHDLPLFDLAYFLGDAFALLAGARTVEERVAAMVEDFAGRSPRSAALFAWLRRGAEAVGLDRAAVGPLVTLSWLHHAVLPPDRVAANGVRRWPAELLAERWLADHDLGPGWRAWG